MFTIPK